MWTGTRNMTISSKVPPNSSRFFFLKRIAGRLLPVCIVFVCASVLGSCDFLRKAAGRPTRAELTVLEHRRDSLELVRRLRHKRPAAPAPAEAAATPAASADAEASAATPPLGGAAQVQALREGAAATLVRSVSRYKGSPQVRELIYLIAGTFKDPDNAVRFCARLQAGTFPQAQVLTLGNGYSLTAVYATDRADEALAFLDARKADLPPDAWFLINERP